MKIFKNTLNIVLLTMILLEFCNSCILEPIPTNSFITNKATCKIELILYFDREKLEKIFSVGSYVNYLENYKGEHNSFGVTMISIDTARLIGKYLIDPGCSFVAYRQSNYKPDYIFNKLKIINQKDTLVINGYEQLAKAFKQTEKRKFELLIK